MWNAGSDSVVVSPSSALIGMSTRQSSTTNGAIRIGFYEKPHCHGECHICLMFLKLPELSSGLIEDQFLCVVCINLICVYHYVPFLLAAKHFFLSLANAMKQLRMQILM